jgi:hypothetical protein
MKNEIIIYARNVYMQVDNQQEIILNHSKNHRNVDTLWYYNFTPENFPKDCLKEWASTFIAEYIIIVKLKLLLLSNEKWLIKFWSTNWWSIIRQ